MKRLKGPELKLSELKVPPVLRDLYWDLRDRRLLPLLALVLVAIVAVPFLLGGKSDDAESREAAAIARASVGGAVPKGSRLVAVEATPGLRNYHQRLGHRSPTNPFKQRFTAPQVAGAQLQLEEGGETASSPSTGASAGGESSGGGATTEPGPSGPSRFTRYTTAIDVKVTVTKTLPSGKKETNSSVQQRVIPVAPLPSDKVQAVAYMGPSTNVKHPNNVILLVSDAVTAVFGDGRCLSGAEVCQLLEVEPGMPETFVFGPESTRYKLVVLNPRPVPVGSYEQ
ncbi:MAG TPA: hypothetical protein VF245_10775 [Solirubrobacterales bacterium]